MTVVTPHTARGRRLALGLFITAVVLTVGGLAALAAYVLAQLSG